MRKYILVLIVFSLFITCLFNINLFSQSILREKLYLHIDKNSYVSGDTLWFKSYHIDGLTQKPAKTSGIEYVELIDKNKNCVKRLALHTSYGTSYGEIAIDTSYISGKYILRAYTNYMQNFGDSLFFQKEITITRLKGNWFITASDPQIQTNNDSTNIQQTFRLTGGTGDPLVLKTVLFFVRDGKGKVLKQGTLHTNGKGEMTTDYTLTKEQSAQNISIEVGKSKDDIVAKLNLFKGRDIDLQFLPESGHLIAGLMNEVGFKAVGSDGKGIDVSGVIKDNTGKEVVKFQSLYKGMGTVSFIPEANKTYTATTDNGQQTTLPSIENSGTIIHVECDNKDSDDIAIGLTLNATKDLKGKVFSLIGKERGKQVYKLQYTAGDSAISTFIPKNIFPTGVCGFQLINDNNQIVNERALFVDNEGRLKITLTTPQLTYRPHDSIPVTITVKDKNGNPVVGSFSLAVTDDNQVNKDFSKDQTILSYILLQSDLTGNIETPDYYFVNRTDTTSRALDALMLTQGFVKYNWDTTKLKYEGEPEFEVKGRVTNGFNKGVKNAKLTLMSTDKKYTVVKDTTTNDKGYFIFSDFPNFDTTTFVVQSSKKLLGRFGLGIELQKFNPASTQDAVVDNNYAAVATNSALQNNIQQKAAFQAVYQKLKGYLPDVVVSTSKGIPDSHNLNGAGQADQLITQNEIRQNEDKTLLDLLAQKVKGFSMVNAFPQSTNAPMRKLSENRQTQLDALSGVPKQNASSLAVQNTDILPNDTSDGRVLRGSVGNGTIIDFIFDGVELKKWEGIPSEQYFKIWLASDIKGIEVITSDKYLQLYRQRFNNNHMTYPTTSRTGDNGNLKVVFIEITTYSGNGPYLKVTPGMEYYHPQPFFYGRTFYSPRYTAENKNDSLPDVRSTIFWTPFVVTDDNTGQAKFYFYSADKPAKYTMWLEGMDLNGHVGAGENKVEIK